MGKHGAIDNKAKRCRCGRVKPASRAQCYVCKPKYSRKDPPESIYAESIYAEYTLADRVAQARACGISYGKLMQLVELGAVIPTLRPVEWPRGSAHIGE